MAYIPTKEADLVAWGLNFTNLRTANPALYGVSAGDAALAQGAFDDFQAAYNLVSDPSQWQARDEGLDATITVVDVQYHGDSIKFFTGPDFLPGITYSITYLGGDPSFVDSFGQPMQPIHHVALRFLCEVNVQETILPCRTTKNKLHIADTKMVMNVCASQIGTREWRNWQTRRT